MTTHHQQLGILEKTENVLRVIANDPDFIVPPEAQHYLQEVVAESIKVFAIAKKQIAEYELYKDMSREEFLKKEGIDEKSLEVAKNEALSAYEKVQATRKTVFDSGLFTEAQMGFKFSLFMAAYNQLVPFLDIPVKRNMESDFDSEARKHYEHYGEINFVNEEFDSEKEKKRLKYRFKNFTGKAFDYIKKLKPFLSSASTIIGSMAQVSPVLEQVKEVLNKLNVGITLSDESLKLYRSNKKDDQG